METKNSVEVGVGVPISEDKTAVINARQTSTLQPKLKIVSCPFHLLSLAATPLGPGREFATTDRPSVPYFHKILPLK